MKKNLKKSPVLLNILFALFCIGILVFLLMAPEETTSKLPEDDNHSRFQAIKSKKEAEKYCNECHVEDGEAPLPESHPINKDRCLFCHKRS
jgi:hypothetical protein